MNSLHSPSKGEALHAFLTQQLPHGLWVKELQANGREWVLYHVLVSTSQLFGDRPQFLNVRLKVLRGL